MGRCTILKNATMCIRRFNADLESKTFCLSIYHGHTKSSLFGADFAKSLLVRMCVSTVIDFVFNIFSVFF